MTGRGSIQVVVLVGLAQTRDKGKVAGACEAWRCCNRHIKMTCLLRSSTQYRGMLSFTWAEVVQGWMGAR